MLVHIFRTGWIASAIWYYGSDKFLIHFQCYRQLSIYNESTLFYLLRWWMWTILSIFGRWAFYHSILKVNNKSLTWKNNTSTPVSLTVFTLQNYVVLGAIALPLLVVFKHMQCSCSFIYLFNLIVGKWEIWILIVLFGKHQH